MYAIVECGGRQYRAEEGHSFSVEKLPYEVGEQVDLDTVLLVSNGDNIIVGQPTVTGASVVATVTEQYRGKKIFVWKYKPKKRYRRRKGHRQSYTRLRIESIITGGASAKKVAKAKPAPVVEAAPVVEPEPTIVEETVVEVAATVVDEPTIVAEPIVDTQPVEEVEAAVVETIEAETLDATVIIEPDDLTKIEGIGPKVSELLNADGITTYAQLAATSPEHILAILAEAGSRFSHMDPGTWPHQASMAAEGDWDGLTLLQDQLDGGKYVDDAS